MLSSRTILKLNWQCHPQMCCSVLCESACSRGVRDKASNEGSRSFHNHNAKVISHKHKGWTVRITQILNNVECESARGRFQPGRGLLRNCEPSLEALVNRALQYCGDWWELSGDRARQNTAAHLPLHNPHRNHIHAIFIFSGYREILYPQLWQQVQNTRGRI